MADAGDDDIIDVVASAGALDGVVVLLREFLHRSGAVRAVALLRDPDAPDGPPAIVDCGRLDLIEVQRGGRSVHLPHGIELDAGPIGPVPDVRQLAPFEVDAAVGTVASPIGGMDHHVAAARDLAAALGDGAVALVTFETSDADAPLSITARAGEPVVITLGDDEYELPDG
jgi:hypothetical protein